MQKEILFMFSEKNLVYILTMLECIEKCWIYTKDIKSAEELIKSNEQKELNAALSLLIAIGEESKKIEIELKNLVRSQFEWSDLAGLRDKISHNYRGINVEVIWAILSNDLNNLKQALIQMIKLLNPSRELLGEFVKNPYYSHLQYLKEI